MKNGFEKVYKWIVVVIFAMIACTGCVKEKDEQKMMISVLGVKDIDDYWNTGVHFSNYQISSVLNVAKEQPDELAENDTEPVKADGKSTEDDVETSKTEEESKEDEWKVDFEIVRDGYIYYEQGNEIDIYYPQINGLADSAKEERINALIEEDVKKIIEKNKEGDDSLYCISLDYEIKFLNERVISILYKGMNGYITPGHGLNGEAIATTIDMEEEKVITVKDVVTDFTELRDMLLADEFDHITRWEGKAGGYQVSRDYRGTEDELEKDLQKERKWYTDGDNFVVITEGRVDYNEYSISNESAENILDAEFLKKLE